MAIFDGYLGADNPRSYCRYVRKKWAILDSEAILQLWNLRCCIWDCGLTIGIIFNAHLRFSRTVLEKWGQTNRTVFHIFLPYMCFIPIITQKIGDGFVEMLELNRVKKTELRLFAFSKYNTIPDCVR